MTNPHALDNAVLLLTELLGGTNPELDVASALAVASAANDVTCDDLWYHMLRHGGAELLRAVSFDESLDRGRRFELCSAPWPAAAVAQSRLATRPDLTVEEHAALATSSSSFVRNSYAAYSKEPPTKLLEQLACDDVPGVVSGLAWRRELPRHIARMVMLHDREEVCATLASRTTHPEVLEHLARHSSPDVRSGVAKNPNTDSVVLDKLEDDPDGIVRECVTHRRERDGRENITSGV